MTEMQRARFWPYFWRWYSWRHAYCSGEFLKALAMVWILSCSSLNTGRSKRSLIRSCRPCESQGINKQCLNSSNCWRISHTFSIVGHVSIAILLILSKRPLQSFVRLCLIQSAMLTAVICFASDVFGAPMECARWCMDGNIDDSSIVDISTFICDDIEQFGDWMVESTLLFDLDIDFIEERTCKSFTIGWFVGWIESFGTLSALIRPDRQWRASLKHSKPPQSPGPKAL